MIFNFKRPDTGEERSLDLDGDQIQELIEDHLHDLLAEQICSCEPIGETNVVECNCDDYYDKFVLLPFQSSGN